VGAIFSNGGIANGVDQRARSGLERFGLPRAAVFFGLALILAFVRAFTDALAGAFDLDLSAGLRGLFAFKGRLVGTVDWSLR